MKQRKQTQRLRMLPETQWQKFWAGFTQEQRTKVEADLEFQSALKADNHLKAQAIAQYLIHGVYETETEKQVCRLIDELFPAETDTTVEKR